MTRSTPEILAHDIREGAEDVSRAVRRSGHRMAADASDAASDIASHLSDLGGRVVAVIKTKPRQTLALGAAVGVLLAFLMRRRGR